MTKKIRKTPTRARHDDLARLSLQRARDGSVRIVDLTQTLSPDFPQIVLPPEMGQCRPFRMEEISRYDERGPGWYWNNSRFGEHTGTHFDAPIHWISGRDLPNNSVDTHSRSQHFIAPACVIDCSREVERRCRLPADRRHVIERWEQQHGRIPQGAWVLMRTDWSKRTDPEAYQNFDETGQHTPGPIARRCASWSNERDVLGFGTETIGTDAGQAAHCARPTRATTTCTAPALRPAVPDQSRPAAADRRASDRRPPLKIQQGSGSPLRVLALVPARTGKQ